jgi:predicted transcriptional regulator
MAEWKIRGRITDFYSQMTPQQHAELEEGIAQAERGEVRPAEEVFDELAKRFGFSTDHSRRRRSRER